MPNKSPRILSLAAALAALTGTAATISDHPAQAKATNPNESGPPEAMQATGRTPNRVLSVGDDLLGFTVTKAADGTVLAQHESHYSHSSHSSHSSHYSSS